MEKTPVSRSKSRILKHNNQELSSENVKNSSFKTMENESPGWISCTQEGFENIDVVWDWNSPQSKKIPKKSQKRLALSQSPKTFKRNLSNNSIQGFEKLQEELRLLKEEIAVPEHEDCLLLSPIEEAEYKNVDSDSIHNIDLENLMNEADDFFDDTLDEQLIICSTQAENKVVGGSSKTSQCDSNNYNLNNNENVNKKLKTDVIIKNMAEPTRNVNNENVNKEMKPDVIKRNMTESTSLNMDTLNWKEDKCHIKESPTICTDNTFTKLNNNKTNSSTILEGKVEFHRTQSFEMSNIGNPGLQFNQKEEIERKRQEALAKLESKRKQGNLVISPSQCTSEEIERKRKEALSKREARRQQEIIERKRQEALRRLEITRKKNAQVVKSSLTSRLN